MSTYPVSLTKASDNTVKHGFNLALGRDGQPRVQLGSREKEAAKAGQRGTIVIQSLHRGSGQHIARDPMMYEFADGMFADEPGLVRTRGEAQTLLTVATAQNFPAFSRGAILTAKRPAASASFDNEVALVVPTAIYQLNAADPPAISVTTQPIDAANVVFTGSHASLGDHIYFGALNTVGVNGTFVASYDEGLNAWSNNAGFQALFLAGQGEKLWRADQSLHISAGREVYLSWSDDPVGHVFSADFKVSGVASRYCKDAAIIGPHLVMAVTEFHTGETRLIAVDTTGLFTELLQARSGVQFVPFVGGQVLWQAGRPRALWLPDISTYRPLKVGGVARSRADAVIPSSLAGALGTLSGGVLHGLGAAADDEEMMFSVYGNFTKRDGSSVKGSALMLATLAADGLTTHMLATPESVSALENAHVMAARWGRTEHETPNTDPQKRRFLHFLTATPEANASNSTVKLHRMDMWDGPVPPVGFDTGTKFLRTSRYMGDDWVTKQGELLRGYITQLPANSSVIVKLYLDGDTNYTYGFGITSAGPFAQALPSNIIGRDVALDMETNANGSVVIEFPWSLDYFAVPDQKDIVRLPVLAGRDQVLPGGGLTDETRAETLDALAGICAAPERWTLSWWDGTPDWDVIPLSYEAAETDPAHVEGAGAAVAWLTLQRL